MEAFASFFSALTTSDDRDDDTHSETISLVFSTLAHMTGWASIEYQSQQHITWQQSHSELVSNFNKPLDVIALKPINCGQAHLSLAVSPDTLGSIVGTSQDQLMVRWNVPYSGFYVLTELAPLAMQPTSSLRLRDAARFTQDVLLLFSHISEDIPLLEQLWHHLQQVYTSLRKPFAPTYLVKFAVDMLEGVIRSQAHVQDPAQIATCASKAIDMLRVLARFDASAVWACLHTSRLFVGRNLFAELHSMAERSSGQYDATAALNWLLGDLLSSIDRMGGGREDKYLTFVNVFSEAVLDRFGECVAWTYASTTHRIEVYDSFVILIYEVRMHPT